MGNLESYILVRCFAGFIVGYFVGRVVGEILTVMSQ